MTEWSKCSPVSPAATSMGGEPQMRFHYQRLVSGLTGRISPMMQRLPMCKHSGLLLIVYPAYRCGGSVGIESLRTDFPFICVLQIPKMLATLIGYVSAVK